VARYGKSEYDHVCSFPLDSLILLFWGSGDIHWHWHHRRRRMSRVNSPIQLILLRVIHIHNDFEKKKKEPCFKLTFRSSFESVPRTNQYANCESELSFFFTHFLRWTHPYGTYCTVHAVLQLFAAVALIRVGVEPGWPDHGKRKRGREGNDCGPI